MAISFINAANNAVETGVTSIALNKPTNTLPGDLMITAFAIRPNTATITTLSGWNLLRRTDNANATAHAQATYWRIADPTDGSSYTWTLGASPTGCAAGICTYRGVAGNSQATIFDVENSALETVGSTTHSTPAVTTTRRNTMLVTAHACPNNNTWTPPAAIGGDPAMTERVDRAATTAQIMIEMNDVQHVIPGSTGAKAATDSLTPQAADTGTSHIMALIPVEPATAVLTSRVASKMTGPRVLRYLFRQPSQNLFGGRVLDPPGQVAQNVRIANKQVGPRVMRVNFRQPFPPYQFVPVIVTAFEMNAEAGSYAITGAAATLLHDALISADAGSYAITGQAADLTHGFLLTADAGVYTITGATADFLKTSVLDAAAGSYVITGAAAELLKGSLLTADAGSYIITGAAAELLVGRLLSANAGSYTITGSAADLLAARFLDAQPGVYTISGADATLVYAVANTLVADPGSYLITGMDATLEYAALVPPTVVDQGAGSGRRRRRRSFEIYRATYRGKQYIFASLRELADFIRSLKQRKRPVSKVVIESVPQIDEQLMHYDLPPLTPMLRSHRFDAAEQVLRRYNLIITTQAARAAWDAERDFEDEEILLL